MDMSTIFDYNYIDVDEILDVHKYIMKKHDIKIMFRLIKRVFIPLLNFSWSLATNCVSLDNETYLLRPTPIDLSLTELNSYLLMVSLDKCNGIRDADDDFSVQKCVPNKTKNENVKVFNMITRINEVKALLKHISCDCKFTFDSPACNLGQKWSIDKCKCECKKYHTCKKDYR